MAETRLAPPRKRVKSMLPNGGELADTDNQRWAAAGCVASPTAAEEGARATAVPEPEPKTGNEVDKDVPSTCPRDVLRQLKSSEEEVSMVIQVVDQIEAQRLGLPEVRRQAVIDDLKNKLALQVESQRNDFTRVAGMLRGAAVTMHQGLERGATFFREIARLERCWPLENGVNSDGTLRLQLKVAAPSQKGPAATVVPSITVAFSQGADGVISTEVAENEAPLLSDLSDIMKGIGTCRSTSNLHAVLNTLHVELWWGAIQAVIRKEMATERKERMGRSLDYMHDLSNQLHLIRGSPIVKRAAYAPVLSTSYLALQRSASASQMLLACSRASGRGGLGNSGPGDGMSMVGWLSAWLKHAYFRGYVSEMLSFQTGVLSGVWLHWHGPWRSYVSAYHLRIGTQQPLLVVIRDSCMEVEGVYDAEGDLRWGKDSYTRITRPEIPFFLELLTNAVHRVTRKHADLPRLLAS